ncbi:MAG TPA: ferritin-like domain-containing protein [Coriobacteriia bacterium]|jgi:rubrerythrin
MEREDLLHKLESLAQLDTDAVRVYDEALEHTTDEAVSTAFKQFQGEQRYHAEQLSEAIVRLGGGKPDLKVDIVGHLADWVTAMRSMRGTEGALHAMETAERYHNRRYGDAVAWEVGDDEVATLLRRFGDDEKRHLAFVEQRLGKTTPTGGAR